MNGRTDEGVSGLINECMNQGLDGRMNGCMHAWINDLMDELKTA